MFVQYTEMVIVPFRQFGTLFKRIEDVEEGTKFLNGTMIFSVCRNNIQVHSEDCRTVFKIMVRFWVNWGPLQVFARTLLESRFWFFRSFFYDFSIVHVMISEAVHYYRLQCCIYDIEIIELMPKRWCAFAVLPEFCFLTNYEFLESPHKIPKATITLKVSIVAPSSTAVCALSVSPTFLLFNQNVKSREVYTKL